MSFEPATGGEVCGYAGGEEGEAERDGGENPTAAHASLRHETVEECEHKNEDGGFREEGRATMCRDCDQIDQP